MNQLCFQIVNLTTSHRQSDTTRWARRPLSYRCWKPRCKQILHRVAETLMTWLMWLQRSKTGSIANCLNLRSFHQSLILISRVFSREQGTILSRFHKKNPFICKPSTSKFKAKIFKKSMSLSSNTSEPFQRRKIVLVTAQRETLTQMHIFKELSHTYKEQKKNSEREWGTVLALQTLVKCSGLRLREQDLNQSIKPAMHWKALQNRRCKIWKWGRPKRAWRTMRNHLVVLWWTWPDMVSVGYIRLKLWSEIISRWSRTPTEFPV